MFVKITLSNQASIFMIEIIFYDEQACMKNNPGRLRL